MPKRPQNYQRPTTLEDALKQLSLPDARPLAGGTRLLAGDVEATTVIDLQEIQELQGINKSGDVLSIGAMERLAVVENSGTLDIPSREILRTAIRRAGPNTFRNAATLGGVLGHREKNSELLAMLTALNASIEIVQFDGSTTTISADAYLEPNESPRGLITRIILPVEDGQGAIERVARTPADIPIVAIAAWKPAHGQVRIAATGLAPRPGRLLQVEEAASTDDKIAMARDSVTHPGDFRGSTEYRAEMAAVLLRRVLDQLV